MRATFANQLAFAEPGREDFIKYKHPFRVNVDIYIRHRKKTGQNWELQFTGHSKNVPPKIKKALEREFRIYIRQRVKCNLGTLTFDDFIEMTRAVNIA